VCLHEAVQFGALEFTKLDFLAAFQRIHERTFKKQTILSAWEKAGLFPLNSALVKGKIAEFDLRPPEVVPEPPSTPPPNPKPFWNTPTTETHEAHNQYLQVRWMDALCTEEVLTPSYGRALIKWNKFASSWVIKC
jgi:hypothetical protein